MCLLLSLYLLAASAVACTQKTIAVFGDSYSTFEGCIPEDYPSWYFKDKNNETDVHSADSVWWSILCREKGYKMLKNDSFSGSCVCTTGYEGSRPQDSFVCRSRNDIGGVPDIIIIFGGTNDCWNGSPLGDIVPKDRWKDADISQSVPALCNMLGFFGEKFPSAKIIVVNNCGICEDLVLKFAAAAREYGAKCIQLTDIDKKAAHPSLKGMRQIAEQLKTIL